jgi:hypothetical protein
MRVSLRPRAAGLAASLAALTAARADITKSAGVLTWCVTGSPTCVDESRTDASRVTRSTPDGHADRRLQYASGYTVTANRSSATC